MNPLAKIFFYVLAVVLIAAFLAPPIYWAAQAPGTRDVLPALAEFPFFRFFSRIAQITALVLLWPLIRSLRIGGMRELGIERNPNFRRDLLAGLGLALLPLVALAIGYFTFDVYKPRDEWKMFGFLRVVGTAAVVGTVEEFLFRGVLLGLAVRYIGRLPGLVVISFVFSIVHFIKPRGVIEDVQWWSGFELLGTAFASVDGPVILLAGAIALFVIGWILGAVTMRTRSLALAIGLHAGWVLGQQTINLLGKYRVKPPDALLPWVGPNVVSGMVPTGLVPMTALLVTAALVWWYLARGRTAPPPTADRRAG